MPTRSTGAGRWPLTPQSSSRPGTRALTHCNAGGLATGGYGSAVGALLDGLGSRPACARLGRRDAAAPAGCAADRLGARDGGDPAHGDRRFGRCVADGGRRGRPASSRAPTGSRRTATRRTRSGRTLWRCSPATTASRSTSSRPPRPSTSRLRQAPGSRSRSATRPRSQRGFPALNPAFDVTPADLITAIVTELGVHRAPYEDSLAGALAR